MAGVRLPSLAPVPSLNNNPQLFSAVLLLCSATPASFMQTASPFTILCNLFHNSLVCSLFSWKPRKSILQIHRQCLCIYMFFFSTFFFFFFNLWYVSSGLHWVFALHCLSPRELSKMLLTACHMTYCEKKPIRGMWAGLFVCHVINPALFFPFQLGHGHVGGFFFFPHKTLFTLLHVQRFLHHQDLERRLKYEIMK